MGILRTSIFTLAGYVLFAVFRFGIGLMLPSLTSEFQLSPADAGVFASAPVLSMALTTAMAGYIADRVDKRIVFALGSLMLWSGGLLSAFSPSYILVLVFIFIGGAGAGFLIPCVYSIMGNLRPRSRASLTGITACTYNIGGFIGGIGLGLAIALSGWRFGLETLSVLGLVYLPIMFLSMGSFKNPPAVRTSVRSSNSYIALLKSRNVVLAGTALFMANCGTFAITSWTPTYLIQSGINASLTGVVIAVFSLAGALAAAISGRLADVWSERRIIIYTGAGAGIVCIPFYLYHLTFGFAVALMALLGFLLWPYWNLCTSMAQRLVQPANVGSVTGLVQTFGLVGGFAGPFFTGFLINHIGIEAGILESAVISLWLYALLVVPFKTPRH